MTIPRRAFRVAVMVALIPAAFVSAGAVGAGPWRPSAAGLVTSGARGAAGPVRGVSPAGCPATAGAYQGTSPGAVGLDPAKLRRAFDYADAQGSESLKVFRHGCLAGESARDALFDRIPANNYGQTKTVVAFLAGIVADRGWVDLDGPIGAHLPAGLGDAAHRAVTIRDLLQSSSGVRVNNVRGLNLFADQSRAREFFRMPIDYRPGSYFEYDETGPSVVTYVLGRAIAAHETGLDFQAFAQRELFAPLGIPTSAWWWHRDRSGNTAGHSQLFLRSAEFGRLGALVLSDGVYDGRRIVSSEFMARLRTAAPANCGFGFAVWLNNCRPGQTQIAIDIPFRRDFGGIPWIASAPSDMVFTVGLGNRTWVIPSLDMVVTRSGEQELDTVPSLLGGNGEGMVGGRTGEEGTHEFFRLLMAAVTDMRAAVRATIANSGPWTRKPRNGFEMGTFFDDPYAFGGSYLSVGPGAAPGCGPAACEGEPNDGTQREVGDIPRTVPGITGQDRTGAHAALPGAISG